MAKSGTRSTAGRGKLYDSVVDTIGDTPVIRVNNLAPEGVEVYVKAESFNPAASVKDRLAISIIEAAEMDGTLKPGQTVVEATSGNTGIGLAMVCAAKGYPLVVTMADSFSIERRRLMRMLGAKVVLTPRAEKGFGMYKKAVELAEANSWFLAHQFETDANADIHECTTGREIMADFDGHRLDYVVTGYGTGGTVTGIGRVLRKERPDTKIVLSEPANAAHDLSSGHAAGTWTDDGSPAASHPAFEPHPIQGWTPGFHSTGAARGRSITGYYDDLIPVPGPVGHRLGTKSWPRRKVSLPACRAGRPLPSPCRLLPEADPGTVILAMLPDTGERYMTTPLFEEHPRRYVGRGRGDLEIDARVSDELTPSRA